MRRNRRRLFGSASAFGSDMKNENRAEVILKRRGIPRHVIGEGLIVKVGRRYELEITPCRESPCAGIDKPAGSENCIGAPLRRAKAKPVAAIMSLTYRRMASMAGDRGRDNEAVTIMMATWPCAKRPAEAAAAAAAFKACQSAKAWPASADRQSYSRQSKMAHSPWQVAPVAVKATRRHRRSDWRLSLQRPMSCRVSYWSHRGEAAAIAAPHEEAKCGGWHHVAIIMSAARAVLTGVWRGFEAVRIMLKRLTCS